MIYYLCDKKIKKAILAFFINYLLFTFFTLNTHCCITSMDYFYMIGVYNDIPTIIFYKDCECHIYKKVSNDINFNIISYFNLRKGLK